MHDNVNLKGQLEHFEVAEISGLTYANRNIA